MNDSVFRALVVVNLLGLLAVGLVPALLFPPEIPVEVREYIVSRQRDISIFDLLWFLVFLFYLSSHLGLLFFSRRARAVFVLTLGIMMIHSAFDGPSVIRGWEYFSYQALWVLAGVLIGNMFFSAVARRFEKR